jgi:hypothetical protein
MSAAICSQCGAPLNSGAHFCPRCGAPALAPPRVVPASEPGVAAAVTALSGWVRRSAIPIAVAAGVLVLAALAAAAYVRFARRPAPAVVVAPVTEPPPVTQASPEEVTALTDLSTQFDTLQREADAANARVGQLLVSYQKTGGALPPNFGADLTGEQRALLADRIQKERSSIRALLQDILDRNKEVRDLKAQIGAVQGRLPAFVEAQEGTRQDRVAMDFLIKQGVSADRAYQLVSQINLQETMLPGFRVWTYYHNGQFGTWVTQGSAKMSPQEAERQVRASLESERDEAKKAVVAANTRAQAASAETGSFMRAAEEAQRKAEAERAQARQEHDRAEALDAARNTVHYVVGSKKALVQQHVISGNLTQVLAFDAAGVSTFDARKTTDIRIDASAYGLTRIKKITLLPRVFDTQRDVQATIDGGFAVLRLINLDKFRNNQFVIVLE